MDVADPHQGDGTRSDARRNRAAILSAATTLYSQGVPDFTYEDLARSVGVGKATVYRHFPTRDHLVAVVLAATVQSLRERAVVAVDRENVGAAIEDWLRLYHDAGSRLAPFSAHVGPALDGADSPIARICEPMRAAFAHLWAAGRRCGVVRNDISAELVLALVGGLPRPTNDHGSPLEVVLRGLRAGPVG